MLIQPHFSFLLQCSLTNHNTHKLDHEKKQKKHFRCSKKVKKHFTDRERLWTEFWTWIFLFFFFFTLLSALNFLKCCTFLSPSQVLWISDDSSGHQAVLLLLVHSGKRSVAEIQRFRMMLNSDLSSSLRSTKFHGGKVD